LDIIERFFLDRGAPVLHEMTPLVGVAALDLLCRRSYRPVEISSVLYRSIETPAEDDGTIRVRVIGPEKAQLWTETNARGWAEEHPEFQDFLLQIGAVLTACEQVYCFLAEVDGNPGAAGALSLGEGVALFTGASTVPEFRRRGLQAALLAERMRFALARGCDLAMMVAEAGSSSQRNAERKGFRIAYTRTKWRLCSQGSE
jgi:GNAT superfamily N-acetyltransferase